MKTHVLSTTVLTLTFLSLLPLAFGQGTFIYDQQSAIEGIGGESGGVLQTSQPFGQSFTTTLSSIGFIRLLVYDAFPGNGLGASVFVNLRSNSITGPILDRTMSLALPDGFGSVIRGYTNFFFATSVPLTSGVTYYFQPVVESGGDTWVAIGDNKYNYLGGTMFVNGVPRQSGNFDLWFREGIYIVPEPSSFALLVGSSAFLLVCRKQFKKRSST